MSTAASELPVADLRDARAVMARHARTFDAAAAWLGQPARDQIAVLYRFCRAADDLVDESRDRAAIQRWIAQAEGAAPATGPVADFLALAAQHDIPREVGVELLAGVASDLDVVRVADDAALLRYAWRVAGTVGRMCAGLFGVRDVHALRAAVDLGLAMQISNIVRDVHEDALRGRVYLPEARLRAAGITADAVVRGTADPAAVGEVVRGLVALADLYYESAQIGLSALPWRARLAVSVASRTYRAIGLQVLHELPASLTRRTVVSRARRVAWALVGAWSAVFPPPARRHNRHLHTPIRGVRGLP